eukprot:7973856-Lingulodinium_polyedra.AAC.1
MQIETATLVLPHVLLLLCHRNAQTKPPFASAPGWAAIMTMARRNAGGCSQLLLDGGATWC